MGWTTESIPTQDGRIAVITGGNGGLGLATALALASRGAHVVIAARNLAKGAQGAAQIREAVRGAAVELIELDLGSLDSVAAAAAEILERHDRLDLLIANAGVMATPHGRTADGFETQFGTNHLGHWALTSHLLPTIVRTPQARIVTVTSTGQHTGRPVDPNNLNLDGDYDAWRAYGRSKLANRHFAVGLQRQFTAAGLDTRALTAHPGLTNSDLQSTTVSMGGGGAMGDFFHRLTTRSGMTTDQGALSILRAATDPKARGGTMYGPRFVATGAPVHKPLIRPGSTAAIRVLWQVSEELTGLAVDAAAAQQG